MSKLKTFLFLLLLMQTNIFAQIPERMSYQAVVRNNNGELAKNQAINVQISILQGSATGNVEYTENHAVVTNENGLITLAVGGGTVVAGSFSEIAWENGPYFIKTSIDLQGGLNYTLISTAQLLSVPYALHAKSADVIKGSISYNDLTDKPENTFSGNYEDLTNKPDIFSGSYNDLTDIPGNIGFTGNYNDLSNKPSLSTVATSGNYNDLNNKPNIKDSINNYGFSGNYNDLINKPNLSADGSFSGSYNDLTNKPIFQDSISQYGFSGDYNDLVNNPTYATVATTGSYNDLTDKPNLSADGSFSGSYNDLTNKPSFQDSIAQYGFNGNYEQLTNKPSIKDSVLLYSSENTTISGSYNDLTDKPSIQDSIAKYGFDGSYNSLTDKPTSFSGNYNDLTEKPSIKDSLSTYGFSGQYEDLKGKPEGNTSGDILYWNSTTNRWDALRKGEDGEMLIMQNGQPTWLHAAYVFRNIAKMSFDSISIVGYPLANGTINDENKLFDKNGLLEVPDGYHLTLSIIPNEGYGVYSIQIDGKDTLITERNEDGSVYLDFEAIKGNHTISATFQSRTIIANVIGNGGSIYPSDTIQVGYATSKTFTFTPENGYGISEVLVDGVDVTSQLIANKYKISNITKDTTLLTVKYLAGAYSIGDLYEENNIPVGLIFFVSNGGTSAKVISISENNTGLFWSNTMNETGATDQNNGASNMALITNTANYPAFDYCLSLGTDWYLPSIGELNSVNNALSIINNKLSSLGYITLDTETKYWSSTEYNEEFAYSFKFGLSSFGINKDGAMNVRAVKEINK